MASDNGVKALQEAIDKACAYHAAEFDLSMAELVGTLQIVILNMWTRTAEDEDEDVLVHTKT